jgi:hypothetical protein
MQQFCTYGSVRGASENRRPYRDKSKYAGQRPTPQRLQAVDFRLWSRRFSRASYFFSSLLDGDLAARNRMGTKSRARVRGVAS